MKSEVITGPLARFGVDIDVQEVFQRLAAPSFPGALIRAILKHPPAVTGDVAQVRLPVGQGKTMAIQLTGDFIGLLPERADQVTALISEDPDALCFWQNPVVNLNNLLTAERRFFRF